MGSYYNKPMVGDARVCPNCGSAGLKPYRLRKAAVLICPKCQTVFNREDAVRKPMQSDDQLQLGDKES